MLYNFGGQDSTKNRDILESIKLVFLCIDKNIQLMI